MTPESAKNYGRFMSIGKLVKIEERNMPGVWVKDWIAAPNRDAPQVGAYQIGGIAWFVHHPFSSMYFGRYGMQVLNRYC